MTRGLTLGGLLSLLSCIAPQSAVKVPETTDVTIFIHGYKGAFLRELEGAHELAWLTPGAAFSRGDKSLALPFEGQRDFAKFGPLKVDGTVTRMTVIPGLIDQDGYDGFMRWGVEALPGFVAFSWDWRGSVQTAAAELTAFIERLGPGRRVRLVGHSMGGLVALECLRTAPDTVKKSVSHVVFLAVPFKGAPALFGDFFTGNTTVRNRELVNTEAVFSFASAYQLMGAPQVDFLHDAPGAAAVQTLTADQWAENRWGLFSDEAVRQSPGYRSHLKARLELAGALQQSLSDRESPEGETRFLTVVGTGQKTVSGWSVNGASIDLEKPLTGDGDGLVPATRALPPRPIEGQVLRVEGEHAALLSDTRVREKLSDFLK